MKKYTENEIINILKKSSSKTVPSRDHFKSVLNKINTNIPTEVPVRSTYFFLSTVRVRAFAGAMVLFAIIGSVFVLEKSPNQNLATNTTNISNEIIDEDNTKIESALQNELAVEKNAHEDLLALNEN